jgi:K+-sensing histidine kinase KdpD
MPATLRRFAAPSHAQAELTLDRRDVLLHCMSPGSGIALESEQRVLGQWMKGSEKNARPQKSLGHGIALSRRFVGVAQEANRLKAARAIILEFWALALKSPIISSLRVIGDRVAAGA